MSFRRDKLARGRVSLSFLPASYSLDLKYDLSAVNSTPSLRISVEFGGPRIFGVPNAGAVIAELANLARTLL